MSKASKKQQQPILKPSDDEEVFEMVSEVFYGKGLLLGRDVESVTQLSGVTKRFNDGGPMNVAIYMEYEPGFNYRLGMVFSAVVSAINISNGGVRCSAFCREKGKVSVNVQKYEV